MIHYETGVYAVSYALRWRLWRGSVAGQAMIWALVCAVSALAICQILGDHGASQNTRAMWSADAKIALGVHAGILGTMMAFRVNQAFQRYWECATRLHAIKSRWSNAVGICFTFCTKAEGKQEAVDRFQDTAVRFTSMMFCAALNDLERTKHRKQVINNEGMDVESLRFLDQAPDRVEVILRWIHGLIWCSHQEKTIEGPSNVVTTLIGELNVGYHEFVHLKKILDTPIPYPYAHLLTVLLLAHCVITVITSPHVFVHDTMAFAATFLSVFAYAGAYYLAHSIERPFGRGVNDLPWDDYAKEMNQSLMTMMDTRAQLPPKIHFEVVNNELTVRECISFVGDTKDDHDYCGVCDDEGQKRALIVPAHACTPLERVPPKDSAVSAPLLDIGLKIRGRSRRSPSMLSRTSSMSMPRDDSPSEIELEADMPQRATSSRIRDLKRVASPPMRQTPSTPPEATESSEHVRSEQGPTKASDSGNALPAAVNRGYFVQGPFWATVSDDSLRAPINGGYRPHGSPRGPR